MSGLEYTGEKEALVCLTVINERGDDVSDEFEGRIHPETGQLLVERIAGDLPITVKVVKVVVE